MVSGPGGVGKDTIVTRLVAGDPTQELSRSWTTRGRRPGEAADAYHFVSRADFERRAEEGGFLEWATYQDQLYGTPLPSPTSRLDLILVIEVQGARQVLERVGGSVMILIVPPSPDAQEERLRARGDTEEQIRRRVLSAAEEERIGREIAHHVVINDDLDRAVTQVAGILASYRNSEGA